MIQADSRPIYPCAYFCIGGKTYLKEMILWEVAYIRSEKMKYAVSGGLAGILNGVLGAGGGVVLVPLLLGWIGLEEKKAFATSVFIILPLSLVSAGVMYAAGRLDPGLALPYLIGGFGGGLVAGRLFKKMPVLWLRRIFGAVLILGGLRAVFF